MNKVAKVSNFDRAQVATQANVVRKSGPSGGGGHIDGPLSMISVAYLQATKNFVADQVFPAVTVNKQSDMYYEYDRGSFNRNTMQVRAPDAQSVGDDYQVTAEPYYCPVYGIHKDVPDQGPMNADKPISMYGDATAFLTLKALIFRENMWAASYFVSGAGWASELQGVPWDGTPEVGDGNFVEWGNRWHSVPNKNISDAKRRMKEQTGFDPNTLVLGRGVYDALKENLNLIDIVKFGQTPDGPAVLDRESLAKIFEVDRVLVMNAVKNISPEGQLAVHEFIGANNALLCYVPPAPSLMTPSAGYHFMWDYSDGVEEGIGITNMRMDGIKADRLEVEYSFDARMISADMGTLFVDAI